MIKVKGHYNGEVVILLEPAPVDYWPVPVLIDFPDIDEAQDDKPRSTKNRRKRNRPAT